MDDISCSVSSPRPIRMTIERNVRIRAEHLHIWELSCILGIDFVWLYQRVHDRRVLRNVTYPAVFTFRTSGRFPLLHRYVETTSPFSKPYGTWYINILVPIQEYLPDNLWLCNVMERPRTHNGTLLQLYLGSATTIFDQRLIKLTTFLVLLLPKKTEGIFFFGRPLKLS